MKKLQMLTAFAGAALFAGGAHADEEVVNVTSAEEFQTYIGNGTITAGTVFTLNNLAAWLRFDESATKDECGNVWLEQSAASLSETGAKAGGILTGGNVVLKNETLNLTEGWTFDYWAKGIVKSLQDSFSFATGRTYNIFVSTLWHGNLNGLYSAVCKSMGTTGPTDYNTYSVTQPNVPRSGLHHIAFTFTNQTYTVFIDGSKIGSRDFSGSGVTQAYNIAAKAKATDFHTDEFRIHRGVHWTESFTPPTEEDYESALTLDDLTIPADCTVLPLGLGRYAYVQGGGTEASPYVVHNLAEMDAALASATNKTVCVKLAANAAITGTVSIPSKFNLVTIDLNGGSITGDDGKAGVLVEDILATRLSLVGTGTVSGGGDANGVEALPRVNVASTVTVSGAASALTLDVDGVRLIYRDTRDLSDIERLIRLIVENSTTPVKAAE